MSETDDQELVERAKLDSHAFDELYMRYIDRIHAYVYRRTYDEALAQDLTATTFEKALRNIRQYEWRGHSFCAWLYRIAHNEIISHHRRQKFISPLQLLENMWRTDTNVEAEIQASAQETLLQDALKALPEADQNVLILRFFEDLSSKEIGEVLGYSEGNVNVRLHRALKRLKSEMAKLEAVAGGRYTTT